MKSDISIDREYLSYEESAILYWLSQNRSSNFRNNSVIDEIYKSAVCLLDRYKVNFINGISINKIVSIEFKSYECIWKIKQINKSLMEAFGIVPCNISIYSAGDVEEINCFILYLFAASKIESISDILSVFKNITLQCPDTGTHLGSVFGFDYLTKIDNGTKKN